MRDLKPAAPADCLPDTSGLRIEVHRDGNLVKLVITARDDYVAMELYEHIVRSLDRGRLVLTVGLA